MLQRCCCSLSGYSAVVELLPLPPQLGPGRCAGFHGEVDVDGDSVAVVAARRDLCEDIDVGGRRRAGAAWLPNNDLTQAVRLCWNNFKWLGGGQPFCSTVVKLQDRNARHQDICRQIG